MDEFTEEELEIIESIIMDYGDQWAESSVDKRAISAILEKIDREING